MTKLLTLRCYHSVDHSDGVVAAVAVAAAIVVVAAVMTAATVAAATVVAAIAMADGTDDGSDCAPADWRHRDFLRCCCCCCCYCCC